MNRLIVRISLKPNFWIFPLFWRNWYGYQVRRANPPKTEYAAGHRMLWLCFDAELALIPKNVHWNPDGTHLQPRT